MHAIQTVRQGGYKLALGFTALVAAFVMSMGADVAAHGSLYNFPGTVSYGVLNEGWYISDSNRHCVFEMSMGQYGAAGYATMHILNSGPNGCVVMATVYYTGGLNSASVDAYPNQSSGWNQAWGEGGLYKVVIKVYTAVWGGGPYGGSGCPLEMHYYKGVAPNTLTRQYMFTCAW